MLFMQSKQAISPKSGHEPSYVRKNSHTASVGVSCKKTKCQTQHGKVMREKETAPFINDAAS
jgi:hypothetical protein